MAGDTKLVRNTTSLAANLLTGQVVSLLYSIIGTRIFSPTEFGRIMVGITASMILATISDFGFSQELLRQQISTSIYSFVFSSKTFSRLTILYLLCFILIILFGTEKAFLFSPLVGICWYLTLLAAVPYRAEANFAIYSRRSSLGRFIGFACAVILLQFYPSTLMFFLGFAIIYFAEAIALIILGKKKYEIRGSSNLNPGIHSSVASILPITQNLDVISIQLASANAAGLYSAVNKWPAAIGTLVTALNLAYFANHVEKSDKKKVWQKDLLIFYVITVLTAIFAIIFSGILIHILLPSTYWNSLNVFRILVFVSLITFWNQTYFARFIAKGFHRQLNVIYVFWTLLQVSLMFIFTKLYSVEYAVVSLLFAQFFMLISFVLIERRKLQ